MLTKSAIFGSALILFDIYFIWYIQAVYLFQKIPDYVGKDTYMFINQEFRRIRLLYYTEDKSRLAENLMKILFKCINVVDYGPEVFSIYWNN